MKCRKCKAEIPGESKFCLHCGAKQQLAAGRTRTRGNGQGTAIKRGSTWTAIWTVETYPDPETRKVHQRRRWKGGFKSKTAALAYAANPEPDPEPVPTLRYYWQGWSRTDMEDLGESKRGAFKIAWSKWEDLAAVPMDKLTIQQLQACVDSHAKTYYPAKDMRTLMSHLFKRAVAEGNARTNLAEFIRLPSLQEKELQPFSELELHRLWKTYGAGDYFVGFVLLMIYTGMMPGELLKLRADMIQWDRHEILGCGLKTKKRKETPIVFPDMLDPVLRDLIEHSRSRGGNDYVVGLNKDRFYKFYYEALERAGVRDLPPYSCRHTTATALALGNIAPSVIQEVMRHTKFSTTQRYIHPDSSAALAAVNAMGTGKEG